jgi:hypothetical protein
MLVEASIIIQAVADCFKVLLTRGAPDTQTGQHMPHNSPKPTWTNRKANMFFKTRIGLGLQDLRRAVQHPCASGDAETLKIGCTCARVTLASSDPGG